MTGIDGAKVNEYGLLRARVPQWRGQACNLEGGQGEGGTLVGTYLRRTPRWRRLGTKRQRGSSYHAPESNQKAPLPPSPLYTCPVAEIGMESDRLRNTPSLLIMCSPVLFSRLS